MIPLGVMFLLFDIISLFLRVDLTYLTTLNIWAFTMLYALSDLKRRTVLFIFLTSFFIFLLGGHFCYEYFGMEVKYYFNDDYYFHSNLSLLLSIAALSFGYIIAEKLVFKKEMPLLFLKRYFPDSKRDFIRKVSKWLFIISYAFWLYTVADKALYVVSHSYYDSYMEFESNAPFPVRVLSSLSPYYFYIFLATFPSKKECRLPIALYLFLAVLSLLTGRRTNVMVMLMFIVVYFIFRQKMDGNREEWIKKSYVVIGIAAVPLLMIFLHIWGYSRVGAAAKDENVLVSLLSFFQEQGFSSSLIRLEKYYEHRIRSDALYSFFGTVKNFRMNTFIKLIFHPDYGFSYLHNSPEFAKKGNSLANALSYIVLARYQDGSGLGSCYVAELYHDFGYIGIAIGSAVYSVVMNLINKSWMNIKKMNIWVIAAGFAMVESFIKAPRWNFDIIFAYLLDMGMWMAFLSVFLLLKVVKGRK